MNLDIAAAQHAALGWPARDGNRESVIGAGLTVVRRVYGERARRTVIGACASERSRIAGDHQRHECHTVYLRAARVVEVLQVAADRSSRCLSLRDEAKGADAVDDIDRATSSYLADSQGRR